jgi:hypothetical protein
VPTTTAPRCLLDVEAEIEQARTFLRDAEMLAGRLNLRIIELDWGKGLIARWDGDLDGSLVAISRALALARIREDRWREMECLVWLAKIDLERNRFEDVIACCRDMMQVAERIGDTQAPVAGALRALACYRRTNGGAILELDDALVHLRTFDDKANLAYLLNEYAAAVLKRQDHNRAEVLADEALAAAQAVHRMTEVAVASAILLQAAAANGDDEAAAQHLARLSSLGAGQNVSARAQSFLELAYAGMPQSLKRRFQR